MRNFFNRFWKKNGERKLITILLAIIFLMIIVFAIKSKSKKDQPAENQQVTKSIPVVVTSAKTQIFEKRLVVQGNVEAKDFAMVSPRIAGTIEKFFVDEGDTVIAGKTKLFQTDAVKIRKNVEIQRHEVAVAGCEKNKSAASLEKVTADLDKAELDYNRFKRLYEKKAVTADAFEQQESRYKQIKAAQKLAKADLALVEERERQAKAALAISQKDLADTIVYAPVEGKVSVRLQEPGEMGSPEMPALRIDDLSVVEVSAYLPAQAYASITVGKTQMSIVVDGIELGKHQITYKSPTIHPSLRTFEVKSLIKNPPEGVVPGAMAHIAVVLETSEGIGVPRISVEQRAGQSVVFVVKNGTSNMIPIEIGLESDGWIEIVKGTVAESDDVVSMGQYLLEDGSAVSVQKE